MGKQFSRRGVSVIIAALLLIAIAVAAAVLLYVFSIGLLGSLQGGGGQQTKEQLIVEAYSWTGTMSGTLLLTVRDVGTSSLTVSDVFVNGILQLTGGAGVSGTGCGLPAGNVPLLTTCTITVSTWASGTFGTGSATAASGVAYPIKVVSADGGVFSSSAIAGQSS